MLEEIVNSDTDLAIFFSFAITTYAFLLYVLMQRIRNKKENQQKRFIKLLGGLRNDTWDSIQKRFGRLRYDLSKEYKDIFPLALTKNYAY